MICSGSSSRRGARTVRLAVVLGMVSAALLAGGCAGGRPRPAEPRLRVALLPPDNLTGGGAPTRELEAALELALARHGVEVVAGDPISKFLAAHRLRHTGAVDPVLASLAREAFGVDGILVTSLELHEAAPARIAVSARLVSATEPPEVLWIDAVARSGEDTKGLLGLGVVGSVERLRVQAVNALAASLARWADGGPRAPPCEGGVRFGPQVTFRSSWLEGSGAVSVAVLPFLNQTKRRNAGEVMALEFVRQLAGIPSVRVLEPGAVRAELLRYRVVYSDGVSLESARVLSAALDVDLVLSGTIREFSDAGTPRVDFSVALIEKGSKQVVWQSSSYASGLDGVVLFDFGTVRTASGLACRMARKVVGEIEFDDRPSAASRAARTADGREAGAGAARASQNSAPATQSLQNRAAPKAQMSQ